MTPQTSDKTSPKDFPKKILLEFFARKKNQARQSKESKQQKESEDKYLDIHTIVDERTVGLPNSWQDFSLKKKIRIAT